MAVFNIMIWWLLAVLILVIGVSAIALCSMIRGEVVFSRDGDSDNDLFRIKLRALFGLLRYKYEIPFMYWAGIRQGLKIQREWINLNKGELMNEHRGKINRQMLMKRYEQLKLLLEHTMDLIKWMTATLSRIRCSDVVWETKIGLGDAPDTAIAAGFVWGAKSSLLSLLLRYVKLEEMPRMVVVPLFNEEQFDTVFRSRFRVRLGYVLYTCAILAWRIVRTKGGLKMWRKVMSKS